MGDRAWTSGALGPLLHPNSVAIVGASSNPHRMSGIILRHLVEGKYSGQIVPVNPRHDQLAGVKAYASLADAPDPAVDVAMLYVSASQVAAELEQCAQSGARSVVILSSGFAELGAEGAILQQRVVDLAKSLELPVVGPNVAGIANFASGFVGYGTSGFDGNIDPPFGDLAMITSSGGLGTSVFSYLVERQTPLRYLIGIGNEAVVDAADWLDYLAADPDLSAVLLLVEQIRRPDEFMRALERCHASGKRVIILKQGRSDLGRITVRSHTGAISGPYPVFRDVMVDAGAIVVTSLRELVDVAALLSSWGPDAVPSRGGGVGALSLPGGGASLIADQCTDHGFELPDPSEPTLASLRELLPPFVTVRNPVDPGSGFGRSPEAVGRALEALASEPTTDLVVFLQSGSEPVYSDAIAHGIVDAARRIDKPVGAVWECGSELLDGAWTTLRRGGVPVFSDTTAFFDAVDFARRSSVGTDRQPPALPPTGPRHLPSDANELAATLESVGLVMPAQRLVVEHDVDASGLNPPFVVKSADLRIEHRTEIGAIATHVEVDDLATAIARVRQAMSAHLGEPPDALAVWVQEMAPAGAVELVLAARLDPEVGPVVGVGSGGVLVELVADITWARAPVSFERAERLLQHLRTYPLLAGYRGSPPADIESAATAIVNLSRLAANLADGPFEIEINPLMVLPERGGALAVDWLCSAGVSVPPDDDHRPATANDEHHATSDTRPASREVLR